MKQGIFDKIIEFHLLVQIIKSLKKRSDSGDDDYDAISDTLQDIHYG